MIRVHLVVIVTCLAVQAALAADMSVQVKTTPLRSGPSFLGGVVESLSYGDVVAVLGDRAGWIQVTAASGKRGWLHQSALSKKRIVLKGGGNQVEAGASSDEIALAGKGFNQQVEQAYKKESTNTDFKPVDQMESRKVTRQEMINFIKLGGLGGGGAQ